LVTPSNLSCAVVFAAIVPKSVQVDCGGLPLGVVQLATWVLPTNTRPPPKLANVVPVGNVTVIVLVPVFESPPVAEVVKGITYRVRAPVPADGDVLSTEMLDSAWEAETE
jgi:hypothetical protein